MNNPTQSTTQDIYRPIAVLQREHEAAMIELQSAVTRGDQQEIERVFDLITHLEQQQREAAQLARVHIGTKIGGGRSFGMNTE